MPSRIRETDVTSPRVQAGVAYWTGKRGSKVLPARSAFDPLIEMPALVSHVMLKDVRRAPLDFRYRLVGTAIRHHLSRDPTGHWMTAIPGQGPGNPLWANHEEVVMTRTPLFLRPGYVGPHREFCRSNPLFCRSPKITRRSTC